MLVTIIDERTRHYWNEPLGGLDTVPTFYTMEDAAAIIARRDDDPDMDLVVILYGVARSYEITLTDDGWRVVYFNEHEEVHSGPNVPEGHYVESYRTIELTTNQIGQPV